MRIVIFGLTISSSWGNGHATLWRALCRSLIKLGHRIHFYEKDVPYYAENRDFVQIPGCELVLYQRWEEVENHAAAALRGADLGMVSSYCEDALSASRSILDSSARVRCFYDLDTPVTFATLDRGERVPYLPPEGLSDFDLVLSYTGGSALEALKNRLGARKVAPLYGSVDPEAHRPAAPNPGFAGDLSYLGTYAQDRQQALTDLFLQPAHLRPDLRFVIGGAQYPQSFPWSENIFFVRHLPPALHPEFYCSSRMTLNITRQAMADMGYCPSGRLFEAAACGVPLLSDCWEGFEKFYQPNTEILVCRRTEDVLDALSCDESELRRIARNARERTLAEHTADRRAIELEHILEGVGARQAASI